MRKRSVNHIADTIFWYALYLLPLILYVVYIITLGRSDYMLIDSNGQYVGGTQVWGLSTVLQRMGFWITMDRNPIYLALNSVLGNSGILSLFNNSSSILAFISYYASVFIAHLFVDFILFIPKLAMKWMNYFTKSED